MPETIELLLFIFKYAIKEFVYCICDSGNTNKHNVHVFIDVMKSDFVLKTLFFATFTNTFNR